MLTLMGIMATLFVVMFGFIVGLSNIGSDTREGVMLEVGGFITMVIGVTALIAFIRLF